MFQKRPPQNKTKKKSQNLVDPNKTFYAQKLVLFEAGHLT